MRSAVVRPLRRLFGGKIAGVFANAVFRLRLSALATQAPRRALREAFAYDDLLHGRIDLLAIELDGGVHAKHRLMRYHDFFVERVRAGERVLDVGCGKGELAYDLAERAGAHVTGIDINRDALAFARSRFVSDRLELVEADALDWRPAAPFDVVVLSNVLEHIDDRVEFLRRLREHMQPDRVLIRVPVLERSWDVGLRRELGATYFSDPGHFTEFSDEQLDEETRAAGFRLTELQHRWGELWAVAEPIRAGA